MTSARDKAMSLLNEAIEENTGLRSATAPQSATAKLSQFGAWALEECRGDNIGNDLDGGSIQDKAESLGLLEWVEVAEPCGEVCSCAEYDDFPQKCLRYTDEAAASIRTADSTSESGATENTTGGKER